MKAIAVIPGKVNSIHLREVPKPSLAEIPDGRGVLVRVLCVGVDGTDREINESLYGAAPPGEEYLILGHESFGQVDSVGANVREFKPGDYVTASVRRPGSSIYDRIGQQDMTTDDSYFERGINLRHGFLADYFVDSADFLVRVPERLRSVAVLMEPASIAEKAIRQAYEIQRRLMVWQPIRAAVIGVGSLGLLASLFLRLRGLEVTAFGLSEPPTLNSRLLMEIGAGYISTKQKPLIEAAKELGPFDIIIENTGSTGMAFEAMQALGKNGVLAMLSVTGGNRTIEIPADRINQGFVLGNKAAFGSVSAHRMDFERGMQDLAHAEIVYPDWLAKLLTHPIKGLDKYAELITTLTSAKSAIKVYCEVNPLSSAEAPKSPRN